MWSNDKDLLIMLKNIHKLGVLFSNHIYRPVSDWWYDYRNNITTRGVIPVAEKERRIKGSNAYQGVLTLTMSNFLHMVPEEKDLGFIDIGCGHGRACFMAAASKKFSHVLGMDFDKNLIDRAEQNNATFRYRQESTPIRFEVGDATTYTVPTDRKYCVFLNNPFGKDILLAFLRNNIDTMSEKNSFVAYINHMLLQDVLDLGFTVVHRNDTLRYSLLAPPRKSDS